MSRGSSRPGRWFRRGYLAAAAVLLLAGLLTGERLWFLLFMTLALLLVFGAGVVLYTVASFSFLQTLSVSEAVKGDTAKLQLEIHNEKVYPFTMMQIQMQMVSSQDHQTLSFHLAPMDSISFSLPVFCRWRGETSVGMTTVELEDMFGLVHLRFPMALLPYYRPRKLLILPKADSLTLSPQSRARLLQTDGSLSRQAPSGQDLYGVRGYQPGDTARMIHWKASAAHGALYTKSYEREARPQSMVILDDTMPFSGEVGLAAADLLCCGAATIIRWALSHQSGVRLFAGSPAIPVMEGSSPQDFPEMQRWLALLPFTGKGETSARLGEALGTAGNSGEARMPVYLFTADGAPLFPAVEQLMGKGARVIVIRARMEEGVPLPKVPDGAVDIVLEPGCAVGERLGEAL